MADKSLAYTPKRPISDPNKRMRVGTAVIYEDSVAPDYQQFLANLHMQVLVSPWHEDDLNPDGTPKKKHKHIVLIFETVNPKWKFAEYFDAIGAVYTGKEMEVASLRGIARYLCHLDNPEKARYDPADVEQYGGVDYADLTARKADDKRIMRDMMVYVREHDVTDYSRFVDFCMDEKLDWFDYICENSTANLTRYIGARYRAKMADIRAKVYETRELDPVIAEAFDIRLDSGF